MFDEDNAAEAGDAALLSEPALARDWNRRVVAPAVGATERAVMRRFATSG